jgi:hypothetical protein
MGLNVTAVTVALGTYRLKFMCSALRQFGLFYTGTCKLTSVGSAMMLTISAH